MTPFQILFILTAVMTLGSALMVVSTRNLVHAALWLILALFGVAVFFVLLSAGFLAIAQVVIYIGAIAIMIIFAVMMTRRLVQDHTPFFNGVWWLSALVSAGLFAGLLWMFNSWQGFHDQMPALAPGDDPLRNLGLALVAPNAYVLPFELASILLLAALVGSIMIAWEKKLS